MIFFKKPLTRSRFLVNMLLGGFLQFFAAMVLADYQYNMPEGVTDISQKIYSLHNLIFWVCVAIGVVVFGVMFYALFKHRKSRGAVAAEFHESVTVEVIWTIIPFVILVAMAIPATTTLIEMYDTSAADITVKVTGYQWKWRYDYQNEDISFFSNLAQSSKDEIHNPQSKSEHYLLEVDNPLVLPVGKKIRFVLTANDVIHAWWVPAIGVKKDAVPGFINESWAKIEKPGIYRGQCAELCGKDHGFMPIVVDAREPEDYALWVSAQKEAAQKAMASSDREWTHEELMKTGEEVYTRTCSACHQPNGEGVPGAFPPLKGGKIATGPINDHIGIVLNGKSGTAMQAFAGQLNDAELAAVITYERNAWGNNKGDTVQPATIKAARGK